MQSFIFGAEGLPKTPQELARMRAIAQALAPQRTPRDVGEGIGAIGNAILYRSLMGRADKAENAGIESSTKAASEWMKSLMNPGAATTSTTASEPDLTIPKTPGTMANARTADRNSVPNYAGIDLKAGIKASADALGIDPLDLATAISYETGGTMDPTKGGPTTQWGKHRGLIQFGEPQAEKYGVDWNDPINSQLGQNGAVVKYLKDAGVKPGMKLLDIYSAINAGSVGKYNASDANNGGAPGTVADKVNTQMADHRARAAAMFGDNSGQPVQVADASNGIPASTTANFDIAQALKIANDPFLPDDQRAVVQALIKQKLDEQKAERDRAAKQADPAYQLGLEKSRLELDALKAPKEYRTLTDEEAVAAGLDPSGVYQVKPDKSILTVTAPAKVTADWTQLDDGRLLNKNTGEIKTPEGAELGKKPLFDTKSTEGQALNQLVDRGLLTEEQALSIAAGRPVTGPNGEMLFLTPQALIGANQPQAAQPDVSQGIDIFGGQKPAANAQQPAAVDQQPVVNTPQPTNNGIIPILPGKVTQDQEKAATFADKMTEAGPIIDNLGLKGTSTYDSVADNVPLIGNYLTSNDYKSFQQAKRDFINSQLRRESGAVISKEEFESADKQYFPQPGDSPEVIEQKRVSRQSAIENMVKQAGPSYKRKAVEAKKPEEKVPPIPQSALDMGIDETAWKFMTPEDRALWQK